MSQEVYELEHLLCLALLPNHFTTVCLIVAVYLVDQSADEFSLKDVSQRYPIEETQESLQSGMNKRCILGVLLQSPRVNTFENTCWY